MSDKDIEAITKKAVREGLIKAGPVMLEGRRRDFICGYKWGYVRGSHSIMTDEQIDSMAQKDSQIAFPDSMLESLGKDI